MKTGKLKILISGGGTGGHIYPAIAVAQALELALDGQVDFQFVGASNRMEMEKVPKAGYPIEGLWISGLQRTLSASNLLFPVKVLHSVWKSIGIIKRFKPDLAIGFGGYASGASMYAAGLMGVPVLIHEQNSFAGITNKILKGKAQKICVAYQGMEKFFPANKLILTGNPVRKDILKLSGLRDEAMRFFSIKPDRKTILVIGGSLGARTINQAMHAGYQQLLDAGYNLIWQKGNNFSVADGLKQEGLFCDNFIYRMDLAYAAADLVVSRAGALSVAEIAIAGKPVILVPSPNVAEDHQTMNAMALVNNQAALLVKDKDAANDLVPTVLELAGNESQCKQLSTAIQKMAMPNAASHIAEIALSLIKK